MIGSKMEPGSKVMIVEDCRDGGTATGQIGIFEGEFPLSVALGTRSNDGEETKWRGEYDYSAYKNGAVLPGDNRPAKDIYLEWEGGKPQPVPHFAMVMKNPRIKLPDGSVIWGAECWWKDIEIEPTDLSEAQKELETEKDFLRAIAQFMPDEDK